MSTDDDWFLYFDKRIALKMIKPCALTYHQGSDTRPFKAGNF